MPDTNYHDGGSAVAVEERPVAAEAAPIEGKENRPQIKPDDLVHREDTAASTAPPFPSPQTPAPALRPSRRRRKWLLIAGGVIGLAVGGYLLTPAVETMLDTVSTDDAYVNGHVTFVAPRVPGQVIKVLVDDNYRVKRGDLLVQLDPEPYQVQVAIQQAALGAAETDLAAAEAQVHGLVAAARANRFKLAHAIETVDNQIANLRAAVATLNSKRATLELANANLRRGEELLPSRRRQQGGPRCAPSDRQGGPGRRRKSLQEVYAIRAGLGPAAPAARGKAVGRCAGGPRSELLLGASGLGRTVAERGPTRLLPSLVDRDAATGHRNVL